MELFKLVKTFKNDESGAVTVDWVVLTAAIVGLGIAVLTAVAGSIGNVTDAIDSDLAGASTFSDTATNALNAGSGGGTD
ncbi:Flp family type IVb pilin [Palleronia sp. KMU-117]|uniref:Flp family type IVb pilin n=1 Tax=Palleronia sp. KMU-117 TaxID=3434108 RepID=UPI003D7637DB